MFALMSRFDIIGDVHGHGYILEKTLFKLGYKYKNAVWQHKSRKVIFLGDFINRGRQVRRTVKIVRSMVDNGHALAILGNHEYNFIAYHFKDKEGHFLYTHNAKNRSRLKSTIKAFPDYAERMNLVKWLRKLPLYLDFGTFRCVHACWDKEAISFLELEYKGSKLSKKLLRKSFKEGTREQLALDSLVNGPEHFYMYGGEVRGFKTRWWLNAKGRELSKMKAKGSFSIPQYIISKKEARQFVQYSLKEIPVFIGHYCLKGAIGFLSKNVCCLDYCIYMRKQLIVYRYEGEKKLKRKSLIAVEV